MIILLVKQKSLVTNFYDKEKYVLRYYNLQLHLRLEIKLKQLIEY